MSLADAAAAWMAHRMREGDPRHEVWAEARDQYAKLVEKGELIAAYYEAERIFNSDEEEVTVVIPKSVLESAVAAMMRTVRA